MAKCKVVEDSDDEENGEPSPPRPSATGLSDITLSTIVSLDGSPSRDIQEQTADPSTSSTGLHYPRLLPIHLPADADRFTELLNRESRAAHKSLIEPTPKSTLPAIRSYSSSQQQSPTSPTPSYLKTKRSKTSIEKPKAKKPLKTYGKSSQDMFEFHGSDGELDAAVTMNLGQKARKSKKGNAHIDKAASRQASQDEDVARRQITSSGGDTDMLSTEPRSHDISSVGEKDVSLQGPMPPPASNFTSFAQSQRSRTSTVPNMDDLMHPESTKSSVLSRAESSRLDTNSDDRTTNTSGTGNEGTKAVDLRPTEEPAPSSSASEISPSKSITIRRTDQTKNVSQKLVSHRDDEHLRSQLDSHVSTMVNPVVLLPMPMDAEGQDELSLSIPETASKNPSIPGKPFKRKRDMVDELDEDDNAIGVPKEHYQPRPSKRRSGDGGEEVVVPTDFSKKPEVTAKGKRKTKRHKTTAFQELLRKDEDEEEEIKIVPDPRFEIPEKKEPKVSTKKHQREVEGKDDTEEIPPDLPPETKQAAKVSGQKKRGRPKKAAANLSEETVADETENDHDQDIGETAEPVVSAATAKKSRKNSKTKQTPTSNTDEQDRNNNGAPAAEDDPEELPANPLNEIDGNTIPSKPATKPSPEQSPVKAHRPPETPRKSTTPAPKGPDKHSPISNGKVAHRVGLSKRARIAPLLRIVRK